jgi:NhaP-type Na+/H+ or K+/H+ antiporter
LLAYGITELISGYGFIAVFVSAITLRNYEIDHAYHEKLHDFADQIERMLIAIILLLFGGAIATGLLQQLTWPMVMFAFAFLFLIRPLAVLVSIPDVKMLRRERLAISFLGIKGIGSFFYLAFAFEQTHFEPAKQVWAIVGFVVLISIVIHGLSANRIISRLPEYMLGSRKPH